MNMSSVYVLLGYIYNLHHAYNVALAKKVPTETLEAIEELSRKFYYDYYKQIQQYISQDEYNQIYTNSYNSKMNHTQGIIFKTTLEQFVDLMFSKPVNNDITYETIEKNVQKIAENL